MNSITHAPIIVALDFDNLNAALSLADGLDPSLCKLKIGKEMFTRFGPELVRQLNNRSFKVFLDLKFHDIPNTVARAVAAAADLGVWMVNVHAAGGAKMMNAAVAALDPFGEDRPLLIGVTVLTSMDEEQLNAVGVPGSVNDQVLRLASLAHRSGLDGVVCSAREASLLRRNLGEKFLLVTPGIRPANADAGDQMRIVPPKDALEAGSDYLVIGRPVTRAPDPLQALHNIQREINQLWG